MLVINFHRRNDLQERSLYTVLFAPIRIMIKKYIVSRKHHIFLERWQCFENVQKTQNSNDLVKPLNKDSQQSYAMTEKLYEKLQ